MKPEALAFFHDNCRQPGRDSGAGRGDLFSADEPNYEYGYFERVCIYKALPEYLLELILLRYGRITYFYKFSLIFRFCRVVSVKFMD